MRIPDYLKNSFSLACRSDGNVLITGPTGVGKTHLARLIHENSSRADKPFVVVNLATLHEGTLESELFGHERGAFTGADLRRIGRFEAAQGGTVFLDEIGELPLKLQARLLEVLQSRTISPVGGNRGVRLDIRIIAATNRDLQKSILAHEFREDLFHRLRLICMELKPIRECPEAFDELVHDCLEDLCKTSGRSVFRISEEVANRLEAYDWPGNVRELRNVLEYAVAASEGPEIGARDLPAWFFRSLRISGARDSIELKNAPVLGVAETHLTLDYQEVLARFEKEYLSRALHRYRGRINQTAKKIGINKTTLIRRIRAYGLYDREAGEEVSSLPRHDHDPGKPMSL